MRRPVFEDPPLVCGHRGSGRGAAENTLTSFHAAVAAGARWVEADARLNADGELVSCHDPTAGDGRLVSRLSTLETDVLGLMRVGELLEQLPPEVGVDIDVKSSLEDALRPRGNTTAAAVAALAAPHAALRPLLVTSFDPASLLIFRKRAPDVPTGLLTWSHFPLRKAIPAAVHLGAQVVAPHANSFEHGAERPIEEPIRVAHEAGLQVLAWNVKVERVGELAAAGADCLVVDDVAAALASLPRHAA